MLISKMLGNKTTFDKKISSLDELSKFTCSKNYSLATFKDGHRKAENFIQTEAIGIDIDGGMTLDEAISVCAPFKHLILPTRSHRIEKNGVLSDRFRIILFFSIPIKDNRTFGATWESLRTMFPACDPACRDASRMFYASKFEASRNETGRLIDPVDPGPEEEKLDFERPTTPVGKLSNETLRFLMEGSESGTRHNSLYKACMDANQQGYSQEWFEQKVEEMAELTGQDAFVDRHAKDTIKDAFSRDPKHPPRVLEAKQEVVETEPGTSFKLMTIKEAYESRTEKEWICDKLLSVGGLSLIAGEPKAGKSTIVRQLVKDVLNGSRFLGRQCKKGSVAWFGFEEQVEDLNAGFKKLGVSEDAELLVHVGPVFSETIYEQLMQLLMEKKPTLVVVDTLFDLVMVESENSYHQVKSQMAKLSLIARETRSHIMCIHHTRKTSENAPRGTSAILGSQAIFAKVDAALVVEINEENDERILTTKGRGIKPFYRDRLRYQKDAQVYSLAAPEEF
jgi:hypothetical protein